MVSSLLIPEISYGYRYDAIMPIRDTWDIYRLKTSKATIWFNTGIELSDHHIRPVSRNHCDRT